MNAQPPRNEISSRSFGTTTDGRAVDVFTLGNQRDLSVEICTYGGIVTSLEVPDRLGNPADIVLGFDTLDGYLADDLYFGCLVGRYCNRIGRGRFTLDGTDHRLVCNSGRNHLHGGDVGFDKAVWNAVPLQTPAGPQLELRHTSPDGDQGYPGKVDLCVIYTLIDGNGLRIDYRAITDRPTHLNLTNHSYFNLAGAGHRSILDHQVAIKADHFTPVDEDLIPTGELRPVDGTPMDFRQAAPIGSRIDQKDQQLRIGQGYDHNWVLNATSGEISFAAGVFEPVTGRVMEVLTTEPGVQFYTANSLHGSLLGKAGAVYPRRCALCLETQHFPDSPNQPDFPSTVLRPGETFSSTTVFRFSTL